MKNRRELAAIHTQAPRASQPQRKLETEILILMVVTLTGIAIGMGALLLTAPDTLDAVASVSSQPGGFSEQRQDPATVPFHERYVNQGTEYSEQPSTF